jgi:hypothetical protein
VDTEGNRKAIGYYHKNEKIYEILCFKVLDVLYGVLKASPVA